MTAEIGVDSALIEKRYFHKDNLHWILKQFKNNSYEYEFDKINDLVMLNVRDFVDDGEFCGIPVEYDHSETTLTRRVSQLVDYGLKSLTYSTWTICR